MERIMVQEPKKAIAATPQLKTEGKYMLEAHTFTVYCDQNKHLYIKSDLAVVFDIPDRGSVTINNTKCNRVTEEDIASIVARSNGTLVPEYKTIELENQRDYEYAMNENNTYNNNSELKTMLDDKDNNPVIEPTNIK